VDIEQVIYDGTKRQSVCFRGGQISFLLLRELEVILQPVSVKGVESAFAFRSSCVPKNWISKGACAMVRVNLDGWLGYIKS
jgi:hypothetical protein